MADLGRAENTIALLKRHEEFRFQKKFGQNFLIDSHVLDRIADAAQISDADAVLEIGPGIGTLTQRLAGREANQGGRKSPLLHHNADFDEASGERTSD